MTWTPEARERYAVKLRTPEYKEKNRARARILMRERRAALTPEQKEQRRSRDRNNYAARTPEQHRRYRERQNATRHKRQQMPDPTRPKPDKCEVIGCGRKASCLDHEHLTGAFRGWLCHPCNRAASKHHTPALLRALADYVELHS